MWHEQVHETCGKSHCAAGQQPLGHYLPKFGDSVPHSFYADDITLAGIQLKRSHRVISENSQLLDAREGPVMTWISPAAPALPATSQLR